MVSRGVRPTEPALLGLAVEAVAVEATAPSGDGDLTKTPCGDFCTSSVASCRGPGSYGSLEMAPRSESRTTLAASCRVLGASSPVSAAVLEARSAADERLGSAPGLSIAVALCGDSGGGAARHELRDCRREAAS